MNINWLPDLVIFNGNWEEYVETLYNFYNNDFIKSSVSFNNKKVGRYKEPLYEGKEETFWHIIQEDSNSCTDRIPNIRRCERIRWPKSIITNNKDKNIKIWKNERTTTKGLQKNVVLFLEIQNYVVILRDRGNYYMLCTAYPVTERKKEKLLNEYKKSGGR